MSKNEAREYASLLIEELLNEVTPEEMEQTNREMEKEFDPYEEAELACIKKLIEITKN